MSDKVLAAKTVGLAMLVKPFIGCLLVLALAIFKRTFSRLPNSI